jgi:drug/metabolite transporter (DMT)-like permease
MFEQYDYSFISRYFTGEKQESLWFLVMGAGAVLTSIIFFFFIKSNPLFFKGMAIPLFALGMLLGIVGYTVHARSDRQSRDIAYAMGMEPVKYISSVEKPRMDKVMKNFILYRWVEIILALAGIAFFVYFKGDPQKTFWNGFGITLTMMALLALGADYFAEKRGKAYQSHLETILNPPGISHDSSPVQ